MTQDDPAGAPREQLDRVVALLRRGLRFYWVALVFLGIGLVASAAFFLVFTPRFRSETVILYREGIRPSSLGNESTDASRNIGVHLKELLLARPKLEKLIDEFKLYQDVIAKRSLVDAVDEFRNHISFKARSGDTFAVAFEGDNPEEAQLVTARLADMLVEEDSRLRVEQAKTTKEFLSAEKQRAEDELKKKETEVAQFLAEHPEFALDQPGSTQAGASIRAERRAGDAGDASLQALMRQSQRGRRRLQALDSGAAPVIPAAADPALVAAKNQADAELGAAKRALGDVESKFTDQHPDVRAARARVAAAEASAKRADDALAASIPAPAGKPAASERVEIQSELSKVDSQIAAQRSKATKGGDASALSPSANHIVELETQWTRLTRDVAEARTRNEQIAANYFRAEIAASSELGGFTSQLLVIDPAFKPTRPSTPRRSLFVAGIVGGCLLLGLLTALIFGILDDRLYTAADVAPMGPVLAVVPRRGIAGPAARTGAHV